MDIFKKLVDLYVEINDIYLNLCKEDIQGLAYGKGYLYLVSLLKEKVLEEKKLLKEFFDTEDYEEIKKVIFDEDNIITSRLKDYIKTYESLNIEIDEDDEDNIIYEKEILMKVAKLTCSCVRNIFLVYASFLDEFIQANSNMSDLRERLLTIKYYNSFTKHDVEEVFLSHNFNVPRENYVDVSFTAETLGINISECDELILDTYLGIIEDMINQLMSFEDDAYKDYNRLATIANASFMIQACFSLMSEKDYLKIKDKIFDKIDEVRNDKNNKSTSMIYEIISMRKSYQSRVRKLSLRPNKD